MKPTAQSNPVAHSLLDLNGQPVDLFAKDRTAISVAVFTRTDCPVSNRYAPEIRRLYDAFHSRGVEFYLVYVDPREQPAGIRRHLQEYSYPCQGLRDPEHILVRRCEANVTPEAVVIDSHRAIAYIGRIDDLYVDLGKSRSEAGTHDLADAIESTLQGRPVANSRTKAIGCLIADLKD